MVINMTQDEIVVSLPEWETMLGNWQPDDNDSNSFWEYATELLHNKTSSQKTDPVQQSVKAALKLMRVYYTPAVIVFGIFGNTIICSMLLQTKIRYLSCTHYLAATVIVNLLHLFALMVQWLTLFGIDLYNTPGFCQFVSFINSLCVFLSIWFVVAFSVDRYIASAHPAYMPVMCTTLRAKVVIIGIVLLGFVVYMNISLTVGVISLKGKPRCSPLPMFLHDLRILTVFDMLVNIVVPYTALLCITIILMKSHWDEKIILRYSRENSRPVCESVPVNTDITSDSEESNNNSDGHHQHSAWRTELLRRNTSYADKMHRHMRLFAIIFLTFFLTTHLPSEIFRLLHTTRGLMDRYYTSTKWEYYLQVICQHVFNTSLAFHVILFPLCHVTFRKGMRQLFVSSVHHVQLLFQHSIKSQHGELAIISEENGSCNGTCSNMSTTITYV